MSVPGNSEPRRPAPDPDQPEPIVIVDQSADLETWVRDQADRALTAEAGELKGVTGMVERIWKHNLFRPVYRQRAIQRFREQGLEEDSFFDSYCLDPEIAADARETLLTRFVDDQLVQTEVGEQRTELQTSPAEREFKGDVVKLLQDYARGDLDDESFGEARRRVLDRLGGVRPEAVDGGNLFTDNLFEAARRIKANVDAGQRLEQMDWDTAIIIGRARSGVRTEAQFDRTDKLVERLQSTRVGRLVNETTLATGIATAASIGKTVSTRLAGSRLLAWASFGATGILGGALAGAREHHMVAAERAQHARERAEGTEFPEVAERRRELEATVYEMREAGDLGDELTDALYARLASGKLRRKTPRSPEGLETALAAYAELEARVRVSDERRIDLISYSSAGAIERERTELLKLRLRARADLEQILADRPELLGDRYPDADPLETHIAARTSLLVEGEHGIGERDKIFRKLQRRRTGRAVATGVVTGLAVGIVAQEAFAAASGSQHGLVDVAHGSDAESAHSATPLEKLHEFITGDSPTDGSGVVEHATITPGHSATLPEGYQLLGGPEDGYRIVQDGQVVADHLRFQPDGSLPPETTRLVAEHGVEVSQSVDHVRDYVQVERSVDGFVAEHPELTHQVERSLWFDNDTTGVYDQNELKLWWGGDGSGLTERGDYAFSVSEMTADGSYHDGLSADATRLAEQGQLRMLFSASEGTQTQVFEVPINHDGQAIIDRDSELGRSLFDRSGGQAEFKGRFAEVAQVVGHEGNAQQVRVFATYEGEGVESMTDTVRGSREVVTTRFEIPQPDLPVEPPPVIPLIARRPLEPPVSELVEPAAAERGPAYKAAYVDLDPTTREIYRERRSPALEAEPGAKLDATREIGDYFARQTPAWRRAVAELAGQIDEPMHPGTEMVIGIPVAAHQESANIYRTLSQYADQRTVDGGPLIPNRYEILLFLNHPEGADASATRQEVERFRQDHPDVPVRVMEQALPSPDIGLIRKYVADTALYRHLQRGVQSDLIIASNDADTVGMSRQYIDGVMREFSRPENRGVDAVLGRIEWDPRAYVSDPRVHIGTRMFQYLDVLFQKHPDKQVRSIGSSGANFAYKGSIYAAIGGYDESHSVAEDRELGRMIKAARLGADVYPIAAGKSATTVYTDARRAIKAVREGKAPAQQWWNWKDDDEARMVTVEERTPKLNDAKYQAWLKQELEQFATRTFKLYELDPASPEARKVMSNLGLKYRYSRERSAITITDMRTLLDILKTYQKRGVERFEEATSRETLRKPSDRPQRAQPPTPPAQPTQSPAPPTPSAGPAQPTTPEPTQPTPPAQPENPATEQRPVTEETEVMPVNRTGHATWGAGGADLPIVVTGSYGIRDGREYLSVEGSPVGVPADEVEFE